MTQTLIVAALLGLAAPVIRGWLWGVPFSLLSIATVLRSFRIPVRAKFIRFRSPQPDGAVKLVAHVFPEVQLNGRWEALESVHPWPLGKSPEAKAKAKLGDANVHVAGAPQ